MTSIARIAFPLGLLLAAACGSSEVPAQQLAKSEAAIRAAQEVGAADDPQAALYLKMARDRMQRARALSSEGERDQAERLLDQAEADAELALALTRERQAESEANRAQQQLEALQQM